MLTVELFCLLDVNFVSSIIWRTVPVLKFRMDVEFIEILGAFIAIAIHYCNTL